MGRLAQRGRRPARGAAGLRAVGVCVLAGIAQPLLRLRRFDKMPGRELRRLGNRLMSALEYGNDFENAVVAGRPRIHFRAEWWWCRGWCPCFRSWVGPNDLLLDITRF